jgi:hypothetical protein
MDSKCVNCHSTDVYFDCSYCSSMLCDKCLTECGKICTECIAILTKYSDGFYEEKFVCNICSDYVNIELDHVICELCNHRHCNQCSDEFYNLCRKCKIESQGEIILELKSLKM